ncbi:MAG: cyclic lactone autoinducer peptide [Muribaculaceae bacterium]|nr:cyclic lactone autoinducer peptide [Muribaculaceae bacterium]
MSFLKAIGFLSMLSGLSGINSACPGFYYYW